MDERRSSDRPAVCRRAALASACSLLVAGCATPFSSDNPATTDMRTGLVEGIAVENKPDDAETTPRVDVENFHVEEAVERVCDDDEGDVRVRVTGEEMAAVKSRLAELPGYSPPDGVDAPHGSYVECSDQFVAVRLLIED